MKIKKKQFLDEKNQLRNTNIWSIEVDYTQVDDLKKLSNTIRTQIGYIESLSRTKQSIKQLRFDACNSIYNTDITDLYKDIQLDNEPKYYVYAHCEPNKIAVGKDGITSWAASIGLDLIPFYIGKGIGNRAYDLNRNETHRKVKQRLRQFNQDIQVRIIKDGLTELEALCLESKFIDIFGLIGKGGKLVNLDEGIKSKERQSKYNKYLVEINNFYKNSLKVEV